MNATKTKTKTTNLSEFRDQFPACQNFGSGKWGWRRVNGCIDLRACRFDSHEEAIADRDATIREGRLDAENGQPY